MNDNLVDVTFVLDESGSMGSVWDDTMDGFNSFLKEQRDCEKHVSVSLVTFNSEAKILFIAKPVKLVDDLTAKSYRPGGCTALLDALGGAIDAAGTRLDSLSEEDRPGKVLFVVLTDGYENASREYKQADIKTRIEHQIEKYNWEFLFLGADIDAFGEASNIGIKANKVLGHGHTSKGYEAAYSTLSRSFTTYSSNASHLADTTDFFSKDDQDVVAETKIDAP